MFFRLIVLGLIKIGCPKRAAQSEDGVFLIDLDYSLDGSAPDERYTNLDLSYFGIMLPFTKDHTKCRIELLEQFVSMNTRWGGHHQSLTESFIVDAAINAHEMGATKESQMVLYILRCLIMSHSLIAVAMQLNVYDKFDHAFSSEKLLQTATSN